MNKIPFQISARKKGKVAEIKIIGEIGWQIDSAKFRIEVDNLIKDGCTDANLYINSIGGSCFDANEIVNILLENFKKITGDGGAIVASAASFIAAHCESFSMPENGQFMIHRPTGWASGTVKDIESYLKMINDMDAEYLRVFKSKASDPEDIQKRWDGGSDYWMNSKESKDAGFVTVVREKVKPDQETTAMLRAVAATADVKERMSEFLTNDNTNMEKLNALLKLPTNATEDDRMNAINVLLSAKKQNETDLQTEKDAKLALQAKLDAIELKEKEANTSEAKTLITAAITDGRLDDDENHTAEAFWLRNFEADFDATKAQLEKLPKKTNLSDRFNGGGGEGESVWDKRQKEIEANSKK